VSILLVTIGLILMATDRLRAELEHLASHDALTGVLNRRVILQICAEELERSQRYGHPMSLMMMDLDHFKAVNDTHGHQAGDRLLADFARNAAALLRKPDRLGRYGGEEFIVALPETSLADASTVAQRFLQAMPASAPEPHCTVSIGLAASTGSNETLDSLLARADAALYRAKELGRNRIELG
jgi:diguanylate cyclase (GGDEF)-like protein